MVATLKRNELEEENKQLKEENKRLKEEVERLSFNYIRNKRREKNTTKKDYKISAVIRKDIWDKTRELLKEKKGLTMKVVLTKYVKDWMEDVEKWEEDQPKKENLVYEFDSSKYPVYNYQKYERSQTGFSVSKEMKREFSDLTARLDIRQGEVIENMCFDIIRDLLQDTLKFNEEETEKRIYNEEIIDEIIKKQNKTN